MLASLWPGEAAAQTDVSLRLRAMSVYLAGLADDPLTDAFLNPARVEATASRTALHVAVMPNRTAQWSYPGMSYWDLTSVPRESSSGMPRLATYTPYTFGLFGPVGGAHATATFEAGVDDDDALRQDWTLDVNETRIRTYESIRGESSDRLHLLADVAAAWDGGSGIRLTVGRDRERPGVVETGTNTTIWTAAGGEAEERYNFRREITEHDALDLDLSGGFFRGEERGLAQGVVGLAFVRRTSERSLLDTAIDDEDTDGNGIGPSGGTPLYAVSRLEHTTARDYAGGRALGRVLGHLSERVRYRLEASAEYTAGDGNARHTSVESETRTAVTRISTATTYAYDGREKRYDAVASLGIAEQVLPELLAAAGVYAAWRRVDFAEDGVGEIAYASDVNGIVVEETAPYFQRSLLLEDVFRLVAPVAAEWRPIAQLAIRVGVEVTAERLEHEATVWQRVDARSLAPSQAEARDARNDIDTAVFARYNFGLGVTLGERFFLDLGRFQRDTVDLAAYTQVSVLVRF
ncbi:MAG: hypothetical protein OEO21_11850 [Candidatus Krumholzibacteria bacterium]|nr:hypothetical protein [Candidatus Krumholzibacteria bacterium]